MFTATIMPAPNGPSYLLVTAEGANGEYFGGWLVSVKQMALAKRLARAIEAGKAVKMVNGIKTNYVTGHTMNADLKRLGF